MKTSSLTSITSSGVWFGWKPCSVSMHLTTREPPLLCVFKSRVSKLLKKLCTGTKATSKLSYKSSNLVCTTPRSRNHRFMPGCWTRASQSSMQTTKHWFKTKNQSKHSRWTSGVNITNWTIKNVQSRSCTRACNDLRVTCSGSGHRLLSGILESGTKFLFHPKAQRKGRFSN